jgi:hypothetical protein|tara:strand:+ start:1569 stop:1757 length:189 start_codon:yes stop_codon:yes gene_type:complete
MKRGAKRTMRYGVLNFLKAHLLEQKQLTQLSHKKKTINSTGTIRHCFLAVFEPASRFWPVVT